MNELKLFEHNTVNIFCDASIYKTYEETIGCPGSIVVINDQIVDQSIEIYRFSTNNHSEINAILMAVTQALRYVNGCNRINIFSDSKISVFGLKEWIFNWINTRDDTGIMYSSSGQPVANQNIFLNIIRKIVSNNLNFNLYHQKGHVGKNDLVIAKKVFQTSNKICLNDDEVIYISKYNDYIDNATRNYLYNVDYASFEHLQQPIIPTINSNTIKSYRGLLNK